MKHNPFAICATMAYVMIGNFPTDNSENFFKNAMHVDDYYMNDFNSYFEW